MLTIGSSLYSRYLYNIKFLKLYLLFLTTSKSFNHGGDSIYNILKHSNVIGKMTNLNKFKNILQSWNGNACKCNPGKQF
jgi:activator of HSP90 ATPase